MRFPEIKQLVVVTVQMLIQAPYPAVISEPAYSEVWVSLYFFAVCGLSIKGKASENPCCDPWKKTKITSFSAVVKIENEKHNTKMLI